MAEGAEKMSLADFLLKGTAELHSLAQEHGIDFSTSLAKPELQVLLFNHCVLNENTNTDSRLGTISSEEKKLLAEAQKFGHLIPKFSESAIPDFFTHFERVAFNMSWPQVIWNLLFQAQLSGVAREVYNTLPTHESNNYNRLKQNILLAYGKNPEHYRLNFRAKNKNASISWSEFAKNKQKSMEQWCSTMSVDSLDSFRDMIEIENFKESLPTALRLYVDERADSYSDVMTLAHICDHYQLVHSQQGQSDPSQQNNSQSHYRRRNFHQVQRVQTGHTNYPPQNMQYNSAQKGFLQNNDRTQSFKTNNNNYQTSRMQNFNSDRNNREDRFQTHNLPSHNGRDRQGHHRHSTQNNKQR